MSRAMVVALSFALVSSAAAADLTHQLIAPNFNPGLKTVPSVPSSSSVGIDGACAQQLVDRIDSGTVIAGPDGMVAHLTGMASLGSDAQLIITSQSPDGEDAEADFLACGPAALAATPSPVHVSFNLAPGSALRAIRVHAQSNTMVLYTNH